MASAMSLVVFDVDGTLVDSLAMIEAAMAVAFATEGLSGPGAGEVARIVGLSLPVAVARLAPLASPALQARLVEGYRGAFLAAREAGGGEGAAPLYPGALDTLRRMHARPETLLGVATGKARRGLEHMFDVHDLRRYFVTAQTADAHPSKPHPSMLLRALEETGVDAGSAVMVGDTTFDIKMGRAAGIATVGVGWGYHAREDLADAGADAVIASFDVLEATVARLLEERR
ncbi:MAG: HAD-IA family hydrolase [Rhodobacteraceae bacterium]|nr:HAD-IA family hydrolase [Paracoccaceae bacterium]